MKHVAKYVVALLASSAVSADAPQQTEPCKSGPPWLLPKVEQGMDVSEQYLLLGSSTPVQMTVCHCTPRSADKPAPHVWVNVLMKVEQSKAQGQVAPGKTPVRTAVPSADELEVMHKAAKGKTQFEFVDPNLNRVVVSRLSAPACMITNGLSVLVMHSHKTEDRWGTSFTK